MGSENFEHAPGSGQRASRRARVLLAAKIKTPTGDIDARLRDLSTKGALVECNIIPPVGSEVMFSRGSILVPARIAWTGGNRIGLEFAYAIDESEVLVHLGPKEKSGDSREWLKPPRPITPGLTGDDKDRATAWTRAVGIKVPRV
jgi:hypothetical protein